MITRNDTTEIESLDAVMAIVDALDQRFPGGNDIFQRVSRLCEESGELASAVNHREKMGIKNEKHGDADDDHLVKEIQDVLRAALGIAKHYQLEDKLNQSIQDFYNDYDKQGHLRY